MKGKPAARLAALMTALCLALTGFFALAEVPADDVAAPAEAAPAAAPERGLEVYYFDVERVDSILIRCEGVNCFIDAGFKRDAEPALAYMRELGVEKLDVYIGTHAHADHIGGAATIIDALRPDVIYIPHKKVWSAILADSSKAQRATCEGIGYTLLKPGEIFPLGGATVKCLGPVNLIKCDPSVTKENGNSLIFKLIYGQRSFLFTGDTSDGALREADRAYPGALRSDVFKNPHHNGAHGEDIIDLIQPSVTVFCTDNDNRPVYDYTRLLRHAGSAVYVTCSREDGTVLVFTDGVSLDVACGASLTALDLYPCPSTLAVGQTMRLTGTMEPARKADPERSLVWKSSNPSVATVSDGVVKGVSAGTAAITAASANGLTASVEVQVADMSLLLDASKLEMNVGDTRQLRVKRSSEAAEALTLEWISEDPSVADVTSQGEILAAGPGTTRIIARLSNGAQAACWVKVSEVPAKSVRLNHDSLRLKVGGQAQLKAKLSPADTTDKRLEWASSDESVATVDESGNVTGVSKGTAKIGVRAASGVYAICTVKVR